MHKKVIIQCVGISAIIFYAVCWFVDQPTHTIWYIGIGLPWLSLLIGILLSFAMNKDLSWAYCYLVSTLFFVCFASIRKSELLSQIPYIAACVSFVAYSKLSSLFKLFDKEKRQCELLEECNNQIKNQFNSYKCEINNIRSMLAKTLKEQELYEEEFDEVILLCRNKVLTKCLKDLINDIDDFEKIAKKLYR